MSILNFARENIRWLMAGFLMTFFSSYGQTFFIGLSGGELQKAFNLTSGDYGELYMVATLVSAVLVVNLGKIVDKKSVSFVAVLVMTGLGFACFAMSMASGVVMLGLTFVALRFFGQGMMTHVALTAVGRWFSANRGRAVSLTVVGFQTGEAILPIIAVMLFGIIGWRATWGVAGLTMFVIALPFILTLLRTDRVPSNNSATAKGYIASKSWTRREVLVSPLFWLLNCGVLAPPMIGTAIFFHQVYVVNTKGWEPIWFAAAFPFYAGMTFIGTLIAGAVIDRWSAAHLLPFYLIPMGISLIILGMMSDPIALPLFMIVFAITSACASALFGALWPELYGTDHLGAVRSIVTAMMVFASALGPGLMGWMIDWGMSLQFQLALFAGYSFLICLPLLVVSRHIIMSRKQL